MEISKKEIDAAESDRLTFIEDKLADSILLLKQLRLLAADTIGKDEVAGMSMLALLERVGAATDDVLFAMDMEQRVGDLKAWSELSIAR